MDIKILVVLGAERLLAPTNAAITCENAGLLYFSPISYCRAILEDIGLDLCPENMVRLSEEFYRLLELFDPSFFISRFQGLLWNIERDPPAQYARTPGIVLVYDRLSQAKYAALKQLYQVKSLGFGAGLVYCPDRLVESFPQGNPGLVVNEILEYFNALGYRTLPPLEYMDSDLDEE